jgi:hypothetical protein
MKYVCHVVSHQVIILTIIFGNCKEILDVKNKKIEIKDRKEML